LRYYLSNPFAITVVERNDIPVKYEVNNGTLVVSGEERIKTTQIEFSNANPGTLTPRDDMGASYEYLRIVFQVEGKNIPLIFKKNPQGRYDLFSAEIETGAGISTRPLRFDDEVPQLCISAQLNERPEVLTIDPTLGGDQRDAGSVQQASDRGQSHQNINISYSSNIPSKLIMGSGSVTPGGVAAYIRSMSQSPALSYENIERLINIYFREADIEGINHDIAIAQMLHWTDSLRNHERVRSHNYGGLGSTPAWNGIFCDMTTGVMAHIQHLKGYASTRLPNRQLVDPRYQILIDLGYLGRVSMFDQLYRWWVTNSVSYGNSIDRILNELYRFSGF